MKRKLICGLLVLGLCVSMAQAALLPAANAYPGFADVKESDWWYDNVKLCNEVGLMSGTDKGFEPEKLLTVAECATVASRIREALTGEAILFGTPAPGENIPWYRWYLDYMSAADPSLDGLLSSPESPCSRMDYLLLLNAALPADQGLLSAINSITALPDSDNSVVLSFYNAGILTGVDDYGTFAGDKTLTRAECAAMISRVIEPSLRINFTPRTGSAPAAPAVEGDAVMSVNGRSVSREQFIHILCSLIYDQDMAIYQQTGRWLDWNATYNVGDLSTYFLNEAVAQAVNYSILSAKAEELGCGVDDLPAKLFPNPSRDALSGFVQHYDLLRAKHILVGDLETANAVLDGLNAVPTLDQFDALLMVFGTDPGMTANPDGYLFSSGEMVTEFENGTRALEFGTYSPEPVQSTYGYHIIWRLDPVDHPDLVHQYQYNMTLDLLDTWLDEAQVALNEELILSIDPPAYYAAFLESLAGA